MEFYQSHYWILVPMALLMLAIFILGWATGLRCRKFLLLTHEIVFYFIFDCRSSRVTPFFFRSRLVLFLAALVIDVQLKSVFRRIGDLCPIYLLLCCCWLPTLLSENRAVARLSRPDDTVYLTDPV
jgi:hypothetical protein